MRAGPLQSCVVVVFAAGVGSIVAAQAAIRPATQKVPQPATQPAAQRSPTRQEWDRAKALQGQPLVVAARRGDVDAVRQLLAASTAAKDELDVALYMSLRDALDAYEGRGAPPMGTEPTIDPVGIDVARSLTSITKLLLDAGADANASLVDGTLVFLRAVRFGTVEQVDLMIAAGADVNRAPADAPHDTPLSEAISQRRHDIVRRLHDAGATFGLRKGERGNDLKRQSLPYDDAVLLQLLLDRGADASAFATFTTPAPQARETQVRGPGGEALIAAARKENAEVVAILLDRGVRDPMILLDAARAMFESSVELKMAGEKPPRDRAAIGPRRRARLLNLLLDEGLDPRGPDGSGGLLLTALSAGDAASAQTLRERGAKLDGEALLKLSAGRTDAAAIIAALPEHERFSALYSQATLYPNPELIKALSDAGIPMPIGAAAMTGNIARVRELIAIDPTVVNRYPAGNGGFGPLRMAALHGHLEVCKVLIDAGAEVWPSKVGSQGWGGLTPLEAAVMNGHVEIVKLLLAHGAPVDVSNVTDTDTTLINHVENLIRRLSKEDQGRRLLGAIEALPLLKSAATRPATSREVHP